MDSRENAAKDIIVIGGIRENTRLHRKNIMQIGERQVHESGNRGGVE
jgi:hypothetical protein